MPSRQAHLYATANPTPPNPDPFVNRPIPFTHDMPHRNSQDHYPARHFTSLLRAIPTSIKPRSIPAGTGTDAREK